MTAITFDEPVTALALTAAKYSTTQKQKEKERLILNRKFHISYLKENKPL